MRLLEIDTNGNLRLATFSGNNIPCYAILSHTWERDDQELTFQDVMNGVGRSKAGYRKVQFSRGQAEKDGLRYFWIDSCCIDKSNNTELSEAINSMFRWYQKAAKCYVYLFDVSTSTTLKQSRWFTRGWTLQELLAPSSVDFFARDGIWLGNRETLKLKICDITRISVDALDGGRLSRFNVERRISWTNNRQTTIEEDQAYCLLGIFDVHMPLIYGEGRENAFRRLHEEIKKLHPKEYRVSFPYLVFRMYLQQSFGIPIDDIVGRI